MKIHIGYILGFSAIVLALCAAFFSVFGLAKLFAGATVSVIIMASSLELTKIVLSSFLHGYWADINKFLRYYLTIGVVILATITSLGIYGYLTSAYQETANTLAIHDSKVKVYDDKIELLNKQIESSDKLLEQKDKLLDSNIKIRDSQESRINDKNTSANRSMSNKTDKSIATLNAEVNEIINKRNTLSDSVSTLTQAKYDLVASSDIAGEIGPLKYIAKLTNKDADYVVNIFILLFIVVFDPLAIALVIATTSVFNKKRVSTQKTVDEHTFINPKTNSETNSNHGADEINSEGSTLVQELPRDEEVEKTDGNGPEQDGNGPEQDVKVEVNESDENKKIYQTYHSSLPTHRKRGYLGKR